MREPQGTGISNVTPIDLDRPLAEQVLAAAANARAFHRASFEDWLQSRPGDIQVLARARPPWRLYRVLGAYAVIEGYSTGLGGGPALAIVLLLGVGTKLGAPAEGLELIPDGDLPRIINDLRKLSGRG